MKTEQQIKTLISEVIEQIGTKDKNRNNISMVRILAYIEALLIVVGVFQAGVPFDYQIIKTKRKFNIGFKERKETYEEHILRKAKEYIDN